MPDLRFVALSILFSIALANSPVAGQTIPSPYTFIENPKEWAFFRGEERHQSRPARAGTAGRHHLRWTLGHRFRRAEFGPLRNMVRLEARGPRCVETRG